MLLTEAQCGELAGMLGYGNDWAFIQNRFIQKNISVFKVTELKTIIRFLKTQPPFMYNAQLRSSGVKAELIDGIISAVHGSQPVRATTYNTNTQIYIKQPLPNRANPNIANFVNHTASNAHTHTLQHHRPPPPPNNELQIDGLCKSDNYRKKGRSPFHKLISVLCGQISTINSKHCRLQFSVPHDYMQRTGRNGKKTAAIHLRLYSPRRNCFVSFDSTFQVSINRRHWCRIPEPRKRSKTTKKAHEVIEPIDISLFVGSSNSVEVTLGGCEVGFYSWFQGLVSAELVEVVDVENIVKDVTNRAPCESKSTPVVEPTVDEIMCGFKLCGKKDNLLRCSRCKVMWYCGADHQKFDWDTHKITCRPPEVEPPPPHTPSEPAPAADDDDEIEEMDALVSLTCPLSIAKIETPVRGNKCSHERCFDLETWLEFSEQTGLWQCPLCYLPVAFEDVVIHTKLQKILSEVVDENVNQVQLLPDGTYIPISDKINNDRSSKRKRDVEYDPNEPKRHKTAYSTESSDEDVDSESPNNCPPPSYNHAINSNQTPQPSAPQPSYTNGHSNTGAFRTAAPSNSSGYADYSTSCASGADSWGSSTAIGTLPTHNPFDMGDSIDDAIVID